MTNSIWQPRIWVQSPPSTSPVNHSRRFIFLASVSTIAFALVVPNAMAQAVGSGASASDPPTTAAAVETTTTTTTTTTVAPTTTETTLTPTTTVDEPTSTTTVAETTTVPEETTTTTSIELPELGNSDGDASPESVPEDVANLKPDALQFPELANLLAPVVDLKLVIAIGDLKARIPELTQQITDLTTQWQQAAMDYDHLRAEMGMLDYDRKTQTEDVASAQATLRNKALELYVDGGNRDTGNFVGLFTDEPTAYMQRQVTTQIVADHDRTEINHATQVVSRADGTIRELASEVATTSGRLENLRVSVSRTITARDDAVKALEARQKTSVFSDLRGFVFPVPPPVKFWDDWGQPRSGGRTHEGNDIIAPWGSPIVAVESGVIARIGQNELGGSVLWLKGLSGTSYYYAHLGQYAPGMVPGTPVIAGTVIAFVGQTGNAIFSVPHLHFEVHPGSGDAVDPYPLLRASYDKGSLPVIPPEIIRPTDPSAPVSIPTPTTTTTTTLVDPNAPTTLPPAPPSS
jgi:murein DD-endopeptidase MepM/ murein hydrolase activator NlpD